MVEDDPITRAIIGAAMEVHTFWGSGYLESVYHKSLAIELRHRGHTVQREVPFPLAYKGEDLGTVYRADLICDGILIELKAKAGFCDADYAQVIHYLKCSGVGRGLLFNFGKNRLEFRRFVHDWKDIPQAEETSSAASAPSAASPAGPL